MKRGHQEPVVVDPVCGMEMNPQTAAEELEYNGRIYYFCATVCREAFEAEPEKYIPHHRQHGLKAS